MSRRSSIVRAERSANVAERAPPHLLRTSPNRNTTRSARRSLGAPAAKHLNRVNINLFCFLLADDIFKRSAQLALGAAWCCACPCRYTTSNKCVYCRSEMNCQKDGAQCKK
ncbi:uncharacterized protein LOC114355013 [Ostrinia furnacalis]|uniref:uncharacterized protein LOC114355013 n=1 Tax=Ostrinia furnacalis TaxID=93504 RepID=UPI00103B9E11|nr:uncharacterized protein LOC114355013 [Ostrinia furnacalis]